jgi:hypothetical protein
MTDSTTETITSSQHLRLIRRKRLALEQLIDFAKNISLQSRILEDVLVLSRPSQAIPDKIREHLMFLVNTLQNLSEDELQQRLIRVDQLVQQGVKAIINISQTLEQYEKNPQTIFKEINRIKELIILFKKRTELSLALRLVLKEQGLMPQRLEINFSQELIAERVVELKEEEIICSNSLRNHIQDVIIECDLLLGIDGVAAELKGELKQVKVVMQQNLQHLDSGKSIESMPVNFEAINIGESSPIIEETPYVVKDTVKDTQVKIKEKKEKKETIVTPLKNPENFLQRLINWLNSPWNAGWAKSQNANQKKK